MVIIEIPCSQSEVSVIKNHIINSVNIAKYIYIHTLDAHLKIRRMNLFMNVRVYKI